MTAMAIIGAVVAALLPLVVNWLSKQMEPEDELTDLARGQQAELQALARAVDGGGALDVATVWARHDRLLLDRGLTPGRTPGGGRGWAGGGGESGRDVHGVPGLDAQTTGSGAGPARSFRTVRTDSGLDIEVFD